MKPTHLYFDWHGFAAAQKSHPPITTPGVVWLYVDHVQGVNNGQPTLVFRVWYHSTRGMVAFIGDRQTGPTSTWAVAMAQLIRAGQWSHAAGLELQWRGAWSDDWDEVQP